MKTRINQVLALFLISGGLVFLSGCKGNQEIVSTKEMGEVEVTYPCSGPQYESAKGVFRSNASAQSMDQATARKMARSNAMGDLASTVSTRVKRVTTNYVNSRKQNTNEDLGEKFEDKIITAVDETLKGVVTICEKHTITRDNNYKTYIALELTGEEVLRTIHDGLSKDDRLKIDYDYEKFKEEFEKEMKDLQESR